MDKEVDAMSVKEELEQTLLCFIKKATSDGASEVEVKALPEVAKVLSELISWP